ALLHARDLGAVFAKPRTALARHDRVLDGGQRDSGSQADLARPTYQTLHAFARTIGASGLHENARANSGMFDTTPFTRNRGGECGLVCASMRSRSGRAFWHQLWP